jgi:hypothetical protein
MAAHSPAWGAVALRAAVVAVASVAAILAPLATPVRAQSWQGITGMPKVAVDIAMAQELPGLGIDAVEARVELLLGEDRPAPTLDPNSADRLQLTISVARVSSSELRGFYLPFSGSYGIGTVRLAVQRPVRIAGRQAPVPAIVWQADRPLRGSWQASGQGVLGLIDEMVGELLEDYRHPVPPR